MHGLWQPRLLPQGCGGGHDDSLKKEAITSASVAAVSSAAPRLRHT